MLCESTGAGVLSFLRNSPASAPVACLSGDECIWLSLCTQRLRAAKCVCAYVRVRKRMDLEAVHAMFVVATKAHLCAFTEPDESRLRVSRSLGAMARIQRLYLPNRKRVSALCPRPGVASLPCLSQHSTQP